MKKRIFSMLLVIAMVLCMMPTAFAASSGTCGDNLTWTLDDQGTLTISGNGAMENYFRGFSPWYDDCTQIKTVIIESGVTTIGENAFIDCSNLTSVTIPDGVTTIENSAFDGCSSLTEITFQGDTPSFESNVFSGVTATAYYPTANSTWTPLVLKQNYGGTITWGRGG